MIISFTAIIFVIVLLFYLFNTKDKHITLTILVSILILHIITVNNDKMNERLDDIEKRCTRFPHIR